MERGKAGGGTRNVEPFAGHEKLGGLDVYRLDFISFIALLFSYDSICGEKRDKVLGYLLSYPISRRNYWISKIFSHISVVMLLLLGGIFVGLLALGDMLPSIYTPSFIYKLLGFIGISLLLITLCVCFGLFASVMTRHSNVSLLICVSFWLFGTIIIPNSATFWGYTLYPTPLLRDIAQEVEAKESQLTKEAPPGSMAQQSENPFYPYHERRAILWMKKKEVREKSYRDYYECLIRQFEGVRRLTLLSPTVQYERAMEALLGAEAIYDSRKIGVIYRLPTYVPRMVQAKRRRGPGKPTLV